MSIRVTIVEDLDEVREGLSQIISLHPDFETPRSFQNAEDALEEIPGLRPDIVVMDIHLPGLDGIECVRRLKHLLPETQFMMFTVYENDENVFEALKAGATGYLLKSAGTTHMLESLKELFAGGSPMSANIARKLVSHFQNESTSSSDALAVLSNREAEVLQSLAKGLLYKEIAAKLSLSTGTVRQHIHKIYEKLHVQNRTEALNRAFGKKA